MNIALLGATGLIGSQLTQEALSRGHFVSGIARYPDSLPRHERLKPIRADVNDYAGLATIVTGHDVVASAVKFTAFDPEKLLSAIKASGVARLLVVGGAGSLATAPGKQLIDQPDFPEQYKPEASAGVRVLARLLRETSLDWTFLSPSAHLHAGPPTGRFRLGGNTLLVASNGESHISIADYATAFLDELERPQHSRQRFTVGY